VNSSRQDTVIVTKRTGIPPKSAQKRRSRVPEIDGLLARWETVEGLTIFQRDFLDLNGLGSSLKPTRKRMAKVSARAKAFLLLWELQHRNQDAENEPSERLILHGLLLRAGYGEGAAALMRSGADWKEWRDAHKDKVNALLGAVGQAIDTPEVIQERRRFRYALGERKHRRELYERLRDELGAAFIEGTVNREAKVRQWEKRRRDRRERVPRYP
jgi:hypothetical protein